MDQDQDDPLDWSVDQVVQYLCNSESTPWSISKNPSPLPDRKPLENALREHGITGEVLLNGQLEDFLRNGLKLKEGPYYTVNRAIQYAQRQSAKYQALQTQERSQFAPTMSPMMNIDRAWPYPFNPPWIFNHTPAGSHISQSTPLKNTSIAANEGNGLANQQLLSNLQTAQLLSSPRVAEVDEVELPDAPVETSDENSGLLSREVSPILRPNEATHVDEHGRKRRRLDLTSMDPQSPKTIDKLAEIPTSPSKSWYMGPTKIDTADIFYPMQADSMDDDWFLSSSQHSVGQRLFVKRKISHFFRKRAIDLPSQKGTRRFAVFPYDEDEANRGKPRYYTLYTSHKGNTEVSIKSTADPDHEAKFLEGQSVHVQTPNPYDYLLQKYPVKEDEDSYPVFGDSGSEGEYDSDTWREIDDEREQAAALVSKCLSVQEVDMIIDQCMKKYEGKWAAKHLPKLELEAHKLWLDALRNRCRNSRIKIMWDGIERLNVRLGKIRKELHSHEWVQRGHLENQCESIERTVFELEDKKQRIAILELPRCPPKPSGESRLASKSKEKVVQSPLDEESLDSDTEDDSLGDFIEDDMDLDHVDSDPSADAAPRDKANTDTPTTVDVPRTTTDSSALNDFSDSHIHRESIQKDAPRKEVVNEDQPDSENVISQPRCGFYYSSENNSEESDAHSPQSTVNAAVQDIEVIDLTESPKRDTSAKPGIRSLNPKSRTLAIKDDVQVVIHSPRRSGPFTIGTTRSPERNHAHSDRFIKDKKNVPFPPVRRQSRNELLEMIIEGLPGDVRSTMIDRLPTFGERKLRHWVKGALRALNKDKRHVPGLDNEDSNLVMRTTVLYIGWINLRQFNTSGIAKMAIKKSIDNIEGRESDSRVNFEEFFSQLLQLLQQHNSKPSTPSTGDSEDDQLLPSSLMPHNKRKRRVKEDQAVKSGQVAAKQRVQLQEQQRKRLEQRLERIGVSNSDPEHQAVSFEQPTVFLHPHIGQRVKPHQLAGIQFMWRELIQNEKRDGCLLAHTMGLGKTMQVISLLVTIAAAANSPDPAIKKQVPEFFHRSQTLILCPPSLIDNWYEEILMWTPKEHSLGPIRKIAPSDTPDARISTVELWDTEGGILILSYHLFRNWVDPKARKNQKNAPEAQVSPRLRDQLLKGPRIIVADEAHQMKNKDSILAQAASMIESRSRIALTGSPLANNLIDYYAMVNWISPKYLDELKVFRAKYLEPIEQGLFSDSTYQEQRRSLKKLQVLKEILNPKINRADISVLEGSLPMKVEFVITVPLTEVQKKAYNQYATSLLEAKAGASVLSTTVIGWLAVLSLCCNHPSCFHDKLAKRAEEDGPKNTNEDTGDQELGPVEVPLSSLGFNEAMWAPQKELLSAISDLDHPRHSYRAGIFKRIVEESVRVGDKILCFSHSIPTLDYLERLLRSSGFKFSRLDGSTAVRTRQAAIKDFNNREDIKVYLISTRAGGLGLNITGANRVIIFDFGFNPTWEEQAVGRAYRLGQKKPVYIYRFLSAGTFEEVIQNKSIFKTQLAMRVVDKKNVQRSASKSLGEYLYPVKDVKKQDISEFIGRDRDVLDKILLENDETSPSILNIALTETFRRENDEKLTEDEKKEMEQELELELLRMSNPDAYEKKMMEMMRINPSTNLGFGHNSSTMIYDRPPMTMTPVSMQADRAFFNPPEWAGTPPPQVRSMQQMFSPFGVPGPSTFGMSTVNIGNGPAPTHPGVIPTSTSNIRNNLQDYDKIADAFAQAITSPKDSNNVNPYIPPPVFPAPPPHPRQENEQALNSIVASNVHSNVHNNHGNLPPRPPLTSDTNPADGLPGPVSAESLTTRFGANEGTL